MRTVAERGHAALEDNVGAVMTRKVTTCTEADTIAVIMERMTEGKFRHMPVVDQGKLVGVISIGDVVKWRVGEIEGESAATSELQAELSERLEAARFYKPEKRDFWTHVTVARVRSEKGSRARGGRGKPRQVDALPGALPEELTEPFQAPRIALYRSFLRPSGAEYVRLAELNLTLAEER